MRKITLVLTAFFALLIGQIKAQAPGNDTCSGAESLTVYPEGGGAGNETSATTSGATDSGQHPSCDNTGTNLDLWYTFTAPASGNIKVITGGAQGDEIEAALYDSCGGTELDCQNNSTEKIFTGLTAGNTYILQVWHDDFNAGDFNIVLEEFTPPANDECSGAESLTVYPEGGGAGNETSASTTDATDSNQHPSCDNTGTNLDLWYSFTAPSSGKVKVITGGAQGDEIEAAIYDSCGGSELDCQGNSTEKSFTGLTAGNTYILQVWHDDFNAGDFTIVLEELNYTNPTFTLTAVPDCNNNQYSVDVEVTDLGGSSSVTVSDDQGSATQQLTAPGSVTFGPYASGTNVTFTVTSDDDNTYTSSDNIQFFCPPANDDCDNAISITVNNDETCTNVTHGTNAGATASSQADDVTGYPEDDVWFSFVATNTSHIISLLNVTAVSGTSTDMGMGLYDGSGGCAALTLVADSDPNTFQVDNLTVGNTYYLRVYGWYSGNSSATTEFDVCVKVPPSPPANDDCANAVALTVNNTCTPVTATNEGATDSGVGTPGCSYYNGGDVWFSVVVPSDGAVTIETSSVSGSSVSDTGMAVYEGSCGSLTEIACDDDSGSGYFSKIDLTGRTAGETLYVRVFEYGNNSFGEFGVCAYNPNQAVYTFNTNDFSFYPNPSSNVISWNANGSVEKIQITNLTGQVVMEVKNPVDNTLNIAKLNQGVYLLHVFMDGKEGTYKLIKE